VSFGPWLAICGRVRRRFREVREAVPRIGNPLYGLTTFYCVSPRDTATARNYRSGLTFRAWSRRHFSESEKALAMSKRLEGKVGLVTGGS
jgi:hypothetical protein